MPGERLHVLARHGRNELLHPGDFVSQSPRLLLQPRHQHRAAGGDTWRISQGAIHVDTGGETLSFPWRGFAEIAR